MKPMSGRRGPHAALGALSVLVLGADPARKVGQWDDTQSTVDSQGRAVSLAHWDTVDDVSDRRPLAYEWFHSGCATYGVTGSGTDLFTGTIQLGYLLNVPHSPGSATTFRHGTAGVSLASGDGASAGIGSGRAGGVRPRLGVVSTVNLGAGPGTHEICTVSVEVSGITGHLGVSHAHGALHGAADGAVLRPFARLISTDGDSLTTYGDTRHIRLRRARPV